MQDNMVIHHTDEEEFARFGLAPIPARRKWGSEVVEVRMAEALLHPLMRHKAP